MFWGAVSVVLASGAVLAQSTSSAAALATRVQARYATVRDFTADFTLRQRSGLLPRESEDRGKVAIKKPDRMRWTFATGSQSQVVADGVHHRHRLLAGRGRPVQRHLRRHGPLDRVRWGRRGVLPDLLELQGLRRLLHPQGLDLRQARWLRLQRVVATSSAV